MGTGYTRQSSADIITGANITASPLNAEFNAIQDAFNSTTGHTHDGTSGEGPLINLTTSVTGTLPIANGGTGATTASAARAGLSVPSLSTTLLTEGTGERVLIGALVQETEDSGWYWANDANHAPIGFNTATVSQTSTYIQLPFDFTGSKIRSIVATPDDQYAKRGLIIGGSIGLSNLYLYLSLPLHAVVEFDSNNGNTIYGDVAVINDISLVHNSGELQVTHGSIDDQLIAPVVGPYRGGWNGSDIDAFLPSAGFLEAGGIGASNRFSVQNVYPISGKVAWSGSGTTFTVTTDQTGTFSASWDGGTNTLSVSHPRTQSAYDFTTSPLGHRLYITGVTQTGFTCQFINSAGTIISTPDVFCALMFSRAGGFAKSTVFPNRLFSFSRGYVQVNPGKVFGYDPLVGGGAIMVYGIVKS